MQQCTIFSVPGRVTFSYIQFLKFSTHSFTGNLKDTLPVGLTWEPTNGLSSREEKALS